MLDCLVIGAGQSGLSCASQLKAAGIRYLLVDGCERVGDVWRHRPLNLHLFTSRQFCRLGDTRMPGEQGGFPSAAEFADYLEWFALSGNLELRLNSRVLRLEWEHGVFSAHLDDGTVLRATTVINATGSNQLAIVPELAHRFDPGVRQLTAGGYRDASSIEAGSSVLVVGDGASGRQIAQELAASHRVILATGRKRKLVPNMLLGRDIFWWLDKLGVLYAPADSLVAKIMRKRDPVPAKAVNNPHLEREGVIVKPRTSAVSGRQVTFCDGSTEQVDAVVWCIGYREDLSWIKLPGIERDAEHIRHQHGRTVQPGFYVIGRKWLTCRASELVLGAAADAKIVIGYVAERLGRQQAPAAPQI